MKNYFLLVTEKLEAHDWDTPLENTYLTWEDALYWAKRMIELGSNGVTIWKGTNEDMEIVDVLFPGKLGVN